MNRAIAYLYRPDPRPWGQAEGDGASQLAKLLHWVTVHPVMVDAS